MWNLYAVGLAAGLAIAGAGVVSMVVAAVQLVLLGNEMNERLRAVHKSRRQSGPKRPVRYGIAGALMFLLGVGLFLSCVNFE